MDYLVSPQALETARTRISTLLVPACRSTRVIAMLVEELLTEDHVHHPYVELDARFTVSGRDEAVAI